MPRTKHRKASKGNRVGKVGGFGESKVKRERGRPARPLPPRIDGTPEAMAQAMFRLPADYEWQYEREGGAVYRCVECGREVGYPETLYNDDRCEECHAAAVN